MLSRYDYLDKIYSFFVYKLSIFFNSIFYIYYSLNNSISLDRYFYPYIYYII